VQKTLSTKQTNLDRIAVVFALVLAVWTATVAVPAAVRADQSNDPTDGEFTIISNSPTNPTTVITLVNPLNRRCP
jgi:uncharacterized protein YhfF